jgi:uracil-DNA glycosylase
MADPLLDYVRRLRRSVAKTGHTMPTPNPEGPLSQARVLFVLRDPGATETSGANETGITDPFVNRDPSAIRFCKSIREANIDPTVCVWWNAMPYHLGYSGPLREPDVSAGARYLRGFIERFDDLRVVVAMGKGAHQVMSRLLSEDMELPPVIKTPHPLIYGTGASARMTELRQKLRKVARLAASSEPGRA